MSANPADEALERLNYFNGQRLAASDFRAEQGHHTGMRRVLNQALYSPGIVAGLQVELDKANKHRVIVRRGIAFDYLGREIFLPADQAVQVQGAPSSQPGVVLGNLLVVSYREQRRQTVLDGCAVAAPSAPCSGDLAWGAPTRIVAEAVFETLDSWPAGESGKVVLAQLELSKTCEVVRVLPGVRQYAVPVKPQQVRGVSLEGEKDIDPANPKVLHFHVDGGYPESVQLYLRARRFSSLYYTEMGKHKHNAGVTTDDREITLTHTHEVSDQDTDPAGAHAHRIRVDVNDDFVGGPPFGLDSEDWNECDFMPDTIEGVGNHIHKLTGIKINSKELKFTHNHTGSATVAFNGVDDVAIRAPVAPQTKTMALSYVKDLQVWLDGQDVTALVRQQLEGKPGQAGKWGTLGDGTAMHEIAKPEGTGEIDLLKLGVEIGLGPHKLEFKVAGAAAGGAIQYNLYVG